MKIAYVTSVYPSVSQRFIVREVEALRARGVEIGLFSVRRALPSDVVGAEARRAFAETTAIIPMGLATFLAGMLWSAGSRPVRLGATLFEALLGGGSLIERIRWLAYWIEAVLLARHLVRGGFEHLHCHFGNAGSNVAMLAARLAGIPFSITCHGSELREIRRFRLATKVERAAFVACISHFGRAQLMLACPAKDWDKLQIIRCGLSRKDLGFRISGATGSLLPVRPADHARADELPVAPKPERPLELLCVGRLSPEKGHLVLIEALDELHHRGTTFRCTLVGDGSLRPTIEAELTRRGLSQQVRLTGSLDPEQVDRQYETAGVVVLASFSEGVPVVLMEAMARGIPVVATHVGGVGELVENGVNGLLVHAGDAKALAAALQRILTDAEFARSLGAHGVRKVREEFDQERSADRLLELFEHSTRHPRTRTATNPTTVCLPTTKTADS